MKTTGGQSTVVCLVTAIGLIARLDAQTQTLERDSTRVVIENTQKMAIETASKLKGIVYQDQITSFLTATNSQHYFGALFLETIPAEASYIQGLFTNSLPRVECGTNSVTIGSNRITDKISQKPAALFWAHVTSCSARTAEVTAGWYSGPESGMKSRYLLNCSGGEWTVTGRTDERIW